MCLIYFVFCIGILSADDDCTFQRGELYDKDRIIKCLQHLPYKKGEGETLETMKTVRSYIDSYAYRDTMVKPPEPFTKYDILAKLDEIENAEYENGLDYHLALVDAFNTLEDAHTNYYFPCSGLFAFIFPFRFIFEVPDPTKPTEIVVKVAESVIANATKKFIDDGGIDITGKEVIKLNLPDLDGSADERPEVAIAKWADKYVKLSRTPAARLGFAQTQGYFYQRSLASAPFPKGNIGVTVNTEEGEKVIDIPFYGLSNADITDVNDMLNTKCPLQDKMQSNNMTEQTNGEQSLFEEDEKHFQSVMNAHKDDPLFQQIYEVIWRSPELKKALSKKPGNIPPNERLRHPIEKEIYDRVDEIISMQFASRSNISKNDNKKLTFKEKVDEKIRKMKKNGESYINLHYSNDEKPQLKVIRKAPHVLAGVIDEYKLGYLFVGTFAPDTDEDMVSFVETIIEGITYTKEQGYKLVVDLRTNGGGMILLSDWLFTFLFPEEYPVFPTRSVVASELAKAYLKASSAPPTQFITEPTSQKIIEDVWTLPKTKVTVIGDDGKERSQDWVHRYVADTGRLVQMLIQQAPLQYRNVRMFAPSDILFLTDGTCGSACSQFLKRMKEKKLGKVVGLGGILSDSTIPFDIGSFNCGNVVDTAYVEQYRPKSGTMSGTTMFNNLTNDDVFPYPGKVPRASTNIRISLSTAYSFDWNTPDEEPEFKIVQPDEIFPIYADQINGFNPEGVVDAITQVKTTFEKCYDWEVKDNYACQIPVNNKHAVYGNPCVGGKFDKDQCKLSRCERGYYLNKNGMCEKSPNMGPAKYDEDPDVCSFPAVVPG